MPSNVTSLPKELVERVLAKLGLSHWPDPTAEGLRAIYFAWCRRVPFDNIRKMIHLRRGDPGSLPGDQARDFFENWLHYGTGGTCWAGNGALYALLDSLGFAAQRAVATMLVAPNLPPNHGSVTVRCDAQRYLVDASILHDEPLALEECRATAVAHPSRVTHCSIRDGHWTIGWRPLHRPDGLDCRMDRFDATSAMFCELHEQSRKWSPFNCELYVRLNRGDTVVGAAFGRRVEFDGTGRVAQRPLLGLERIEFLIEEIGIHEGLAHALPQDLPTPPPPSLAAGGESREMNL
jgi:N-hydroxyarylamine O-acetyltransferase